MIQINKKHLEIWIYIFGTKLYKHLLVVQFFLNEKHIFSSFGGVRLLTAYMQKNHSQVFSFLCSKESIIFCQKNGKWKTNLIYYDKPDIGIMVRVFANDPGDLGSIPGRVIPKTQKMLLDATLFNTQHCKVKIKGKVEQSREWSNTLPYTLV